MFKLPNTNAMNLILPAIIVLVVAGIVAGIGQDILGEVASDMDSGSVERNSTEDAQEGISNVTEKFDLLGLAIIAGIIIAVIIGFFAFKGVMS